MRQVLRWIPPGRFRVGSPPGELGRLDNERQHDVTLSRGFWLAETACIQALWRAVTGENPSYFKDDPELPVEVVSWLDCEQFTGRPARAIPAGARLTGTAGFLAGASPSRLETASAASELVKGRVHGRPSGGASSAIPSLQRRRSRAGGIEPPACEAG